MVASGDLGEKEEYINPVICDFLLFIAEWILKVPLSNEFPFGYDDVKVICSRQRGTGIQHEYLIKITDGKGNEQQSSVLERLRKTIGQKSWNGFKKI